MGNRGARRVRKLARAAAALLLLAAAPLRAQTAGIIPPLLPAPVWVYNDWSAYDELSDTVPLTEELAMREFHEVERLRQAGVRFDYYMMDAFWFDPAGGYRTWRKPEWPDGPDRWIAACRAAGIKPGLWFGTNTLTALQPAPAWRSSLAPDGRAMALYAGGFLADFMNMLQSWYDRGIRMFKLDFADFNAALKGDGERLAPAEIRQRNARALHDALRAFRKRNPDAVLVAFNGIVGDIESPSVPLNPFNIHWLDVFDSVYSGDPRPSDVPQMDMWRSIDIYSDEMVRHFALGGAVPLSRIDSTAFMVGDTGTNYHRRSAAWRGSLLLMAARGGWINTVHGNLEFLDEEAARWLARVQRLYEPLQRAGINRPFGGAPAEAQPYGFASVVAAGALYAAVNPSQRVRTIRLPRLSPEQPLNAGGRMLFRDVGYEPALEGDMLRLGPGQLALVGYGSFSSADHDLGVERDIRVPRAIAPARIRFHEVEEAPENESPPEPLPEGARADTEQPLPIEAVLMPPANGDLRVVLRQRDEDGTPARAFAPRPMGQVFTIRALQDGKPLPVEIRYDQVIWSGLSWAVGEIHHDEFAPGKPIRLRLAVTEHDPDLHLDGQVYWVEY
jgi:hypothetical protein